MYRIAEREMPHENGQQGASWANDSRRLERGNWLARWLESVRMLGRAVERLLGAGLIQGLIFPLNLHCNALM